MVSKRTGIVTWGGLMCALALQWNCRAEYMEVEWIRPSGSNGDSAIILDYTPSATDRVEMKVSLGDLTRDQALWCARSALGGTFTAYYVKDSRQFRFDRRTTPGVLSGVQVEENRSYEIVADYADCTVTLDGTLLEASLRQGEYEVGSRLVLFASHQDAEVGPTSSFGNYSRARLFYFRVKDAEGNLTLDLVPARDTDATDPASEYGLYDRVGERFYTNVLGEAFAHGNELEAGLPRLENERLTRYAGVSSVRATVTGAPAVGGYRLSGADGSCEVFAEGETGAGETFALDIDTASLADGFYGVFALARNENGVSASEVGQLFVGATDGLAVWIGQDSGDKKASTASNWSTGAVPTALSDVVFDPAYSSASCTFDAAWAEASGGDTVRSLTIKDGYAGMVVVATTVDDPPSGTPAFPQFAVAEDVILAGGRLAAQTHSTAQNPRYRLRMRIGGDLVLEKRDDTAAMYHYGWITTNERGRFSLTSPYRYYAPHGGDAGVVKADADEEYVADRYVGFGSVFAPITAAIGAFYGTDSDDKKSRGGGAIELEVAGDFVNDGKVDAVGSVTTAGAGPGGSIYIRARSIRGTGTFSVRGSKARKTDNNAAASAGGRVALVAAETNEIAASQVQAEGAVAPRDGKEYLNAGAAGTIYLKGANVDQVLVKNTQATRSFVSTPIPAQADEAILFKPVDLCISDYGFAYLTQDVRCKSLTLGAATDRIDLNGKRLRVKELRVGGKKVKGGSYAIAPTSKLAIGGETIAGIMNTAAAEARLEIGCGMVVVVR